MKPSHKTSRLLGVAFLLQFVTSLFSGVVLSPALIVPEEVSDTLGRISANPLLMRAYILVDMLTALGILFLGVMLYLTLRNQSEVTALIGLVFYGLEAALLAVSRGDAFSLLWISQEYANAGSSPYLESLAGQALQSMDFVGFTLHLLAFCLGAVLFYSLLYTSRVVPRWLSLWGLITVLPILAATLFLIMGTELPFFLAIPYIPFEFVIGVWILAKGTGRDPEGT